MTRNHPITLQWKAIKRNDVLAKVPGWKFIPGSKAEKVAKGKVRNAIMF
jgi:hypothetical protein